MTQDALYQDILKYTPQHDNVAKIGFFFLPTKFLRHFFISSHKRHTTISAQDKCSTKHFWGTDNITFMCFVQINLAGAHPPPLGLLLGDTFFSNNRRWPLTISSEKNIQMNRFMSPHNINRLRPLIIKFYTDNVR